MSNMFYFQKNNSSLQFFAVCDILCLGGLPLYFSFKVGHVTFMPFSKTMSRRTEQEFRANRVRGLNKC